MPERLTGIAKALRHLVFIRKKALLKRILAGYWNSLVLRRETLRSIELAVTYSCQARCHKCYAARLRKDEKQYLSVEQIRGIVDSALGLGLIHVNITGGEPTLRKDVPEIISACHPDKIMVSLVTNAYAMTRELLRRYKDAGLNTIQISLDSSTPEVHDSLRGLDGGYRKVMETAAWARELGLVVCFSTVLSSENSSGENEMLKLLELADREDAFLLICDSAAVGGWEGQKDKMLDGEERNRALAKLLRHPRARHHAIYNFRGKAGCPAGTEKIYLTAYGDATPCDLVHDCFGNVLEDGLEKVWRKMCAHPLYARKSFDCVRYLPDFAGRKLP